MYKKNFGIIFFVCLFLLSVGGSPVFALETNYSNILGIPEPTSPETAINFWFQITAYISGVIAIISFSIAGIQLVWGETNPSIKKDAKERMISAVVGLFLSAAAVVILRSINPSLINVVITDLGPQTGVFYTNGSNYAPAPQSESNNSNILNGYNNIAYRCTQGPAILLWIFPKPNFLGNNDNYEGVKVLRKECNSQEPLPKGGSFRWEFESSGVYFCMGGCGETGTVCDGHMSFVQTVSTNIIKPFSGKISSVRIVNDIQNDIHYAAIFHSASDLGQLGSCSNFIYSSDLNKKYECFNNIPTAQLAVIFNWNHKLTTDSNGNIISTSGQGVDFYSEPYGWAQGARSGKKSLNAQTIDTYWSGAASSLIYNYDGIVRPSRYKQIYTSFAQKPGSVNVKGSYILAFRSGSYCQIFSESIYNFKTTQMSAVVGSIGNINIMPVK